MRNKVLLRNVVTGIFLIVFNGAIAQTLTTPVSDSVQIKKSGAEQIRKARKNTISFNITNPSIIAPKFLTVGYERILKNNQSFMVQTGSFSIPRFIESLSDSLGINSKYRDRGFHLSVDYRFYLKNENKYEAPRGVYLGAYYAYNFLNRNVDWVFEGEKLKSTVNTDFNVGIHAIGVEIGYQFVFWDRMSVDLILAGPGIGFYDVKAKLNTSLNSDEQSEFFDELDEYLSNNFPGYQGFFDSGEFKRNGSFNTLELAYRYSVRIGYRF